MVGAGGPTKREGGGEVKERKGFSHAERGGGQKGGWLF